MPSVDLVVSVGGDVNSLIGRTVYVVIALPDPLYQQQVEVISVGYVPGSKVPEVDLRMHGAPSPAVGTYSSTLQLIACLDVACKQELGNSPYAIPYSVTVFPGLELSTENIEVDVPFAVMPEPSEVSVRVPPGTTNWDFSQNPSDGAIRGKKKAGDGSEIEISYTFAAPGEYQSQFQVEATVPDPRGYSVPPFSKVLTVTYKVEAVPEQFVVVPRSVSFQTAVNDPTQKYVELTYLFQKRADAGIVEKRVDYLSAPNAAASSANRAKWVHFSDFPNDFFIVPCGTNPVEPECLPAGTYTATIHYTCNGDDGVVNEFEQPVEMKIAP